MQHKPAGSRTPLFILFMLVAALVSACGGGGGGATTAATALWVGTKQRGVAGATTYGHGVATDPGGNVHVVGSPTGGLDGNALTGTEDFFGTQYNSSGVKQYTRQLSVAGRYRLPPASQRTPAAMST